MQAHPLAYVSEQMDHVYRHHGTDLDPQFAEVQGL